MMPMLTRESWLAAAEAAERAADHWHRQGCSAQLAHAAMLRRKAANFRAKAT